MQAYGFDASGRMKAPLDHLCFIWMSHRPNPFYRSFFFSLMASMQRGNDWNPTDRGHWEAQGWLAGSKPF